MRIAVVYGNEGADVRVAKTCGTLVKAGHEVHFIGWNRRPDVPLDESSLLPGVTRHIVEHAVPQRSSTPSGQWAFTRHAIRTLRQLRPDVVHAINEDNVVRIGWLKGWAFRQLICDVFDSHLDKHTDRNFLIRGIAAGVVHAVRWWSDRLIATDDVRYETFGWARPKTTVIGNYPPDPGEEWSRRYPSGAPKIFASGTLSRVRGTGQLLAAAEQVPGLEIVAAGWAADEFTEQVFLKHPAVQFVGQVSPQRSLELAAECDAIVAMYEPYCRNHILASPNKIYDALSVGRPVIINSEAVVSRWVQAHETGFACPYADTSALAGFFSTLQERRKSLPSFARRCRELFLAGYSWGAMESRLLELYSGLTAELPGREVSPPTLPLSQAAPPESYTSAKAA